MGPHALNIIGSYDFTYHRPHGSEDNYMRIAHIDGYEKPHFFNLDVRLNFTNGLYLTYMRTQLMDKGIMAHTTKRNDFQIGYRLYL